MNPELSTGAAPALLALGEAMIEFNQSEVQSPERFLRGFGGDTSNMAIAAARLARGTTPPLRVGYLTRVGDEPFGHALLALWRDEGVDTQGVGLDPAHPTGVYFVTHGPAGHAFSYLRAGSAASRMRPSDLPRTLLQSAKALHVSGISQAISTEACDSVFAAIDVMRESGGRVAYDPNLRLKLWPLARARAVIEATMRLVHWCLPSLDDARVLSGLDSPEANLQWAHDCGARVVALKCGAQGVLISDGTRRERLEGHRVATVDATGAGDCFDGAFLVRVLAGDDPFAAARYANAAAALATTGYGAVAPLPRHADVEALLARTGR